jgi:histone H3/H4
VLLRNIMISEQQFVSNSVMSAPLLFPSAKAREVAAADPDVKDISKQAVDMLRHAAQLFAHSLFTKCADEARHRKRLTASLRDFLAVVAREDGLRAMLGQFVAGSGDPEVEIEAGPEEEDRDETDAPSEIEDILRRDSSDDA